MNGAKDGMGWRFIFQQGSDPNHLVDSAKSTLQWLKKQRRNNFLEKVKKIT